MELYKITDRVYCLPYEAYNDRPNLYYIKGDYFSVAIDAGNSQAHVEKFYNNLREAGLPLPEYTIITHWHWDHTFGMHAVNGKTIACKPTNDKLKEVMGWKWTIEDMVQREKEGKDIRFCNEHILYEYADLDTIKVIEADEIVEEDRIIDLGGVTLRLMSRDSAHSRDCLYVLDETDKCLFMGDGDSVDFYDNYEMYDAKHLGDMIRFLEGLDYTWHLIGHLEESKKEDAIAFLKSELMKIGKPIMI